MRRKEYPEADYASIELEEGEALPREESRYVRISLPASSGREEELAQAGFLWADRTIGVKVPLKRGEGFQERCRMPVELTDGYREGIRRIAQNSLREDRRFAVSFPGDGAEPAEKIIDLWLKEQEEAFVCLHNGEAAGFAQVRFPDECRGMPFIHLAAVDPAYRVAGAAVSLYAGVFEHFRLKGAAAAYGRISSGNMAVLNLYASFGAQFSKPLDIYIRTQRSMQ